jgi:hypothetical protein
MPKLFLERQSPRLRSPKQVDINGKGKSLFVMHCPIKKIAWKCKEQLTKWCAPCWIEV